jgi:uncharacterized protein (DUF433 family)
MATVQPIETIVSDQHVRGGQPIIDGTTVRVSDIVASHIYRGFSADELAVNFALNLGQIYAALAFYYQHKAEIDQQMRLDAAKADRLLAEFDAQKRLIRVE